VQHYAAFKQIAIRTVQSWFVQSQQADLDRYIDALLKTTPISMYRSATSIMQETSGETMLQSFRQLHMPKYFLIGEETLKKRKLPDFCAQTDVQTLVVAGVGHMMMVDNPDLFNRTLASTLP